MATTTYDAIRDQIILTIEAITPAFLSDKRFERAPRRQRLRDWVQGQNSSSGIFRRFEIEDGQATEPPFMDPTQIERNETLILRVAYPALPTLYGELQVDDMEKVIRRDARDIRDTVFKATNYVSAAVKAQFPNDLQELEQVSTDAWFKTFSILCIYNEAQSL